MLYTTRAICQKLAVKPSRLGAASVCRSNGVSRFFQLKRSFAAAVPTSPASCSTGSSGPAAMPFSEVPFFSPVVSKRGCVVQEQAPDFTADAVFPDDSIKPLTLSAYRGQYVVLFFYPLDFTFVCPSEIVAFSQRVQEFASRNAQLIGVSVDSQFTHAAWRATPLEQGGISKVQFPLVSDLSKAIARKYNVLVKEQTVSLRGLFLIDKKGIVRHMVVNDLPLGRSVDEALRVLDALQHIETTGEVCPANWKKGAKAMKPTTSGVAEYLSAASS